jgi:hypothetical protein
VSGVSRRDFLVRGGAVAVSALVVGGLARDRSIRSSPTSLYSDLYELVRTEDQLCLKVMLVKSAIVIEDGKRYVVPESPGAVKPAIAFEFPVQHTMEWPSSAQPSKPVFTARRNFVRVALPPGAKVPFTTVGLLTALRDFPIVTEPFAGELEVADAPSAQATLVPAAALLRGGGHVDDALMRGRAEVPDEVPVRVAEGAQPADPPGATPPAAAVETAIAFPSRLIIPLPAGAARFTHAVEPERHDELTEIWHTRLARLASDGGRVEGPIKLRASGGIFVGHGNGQYAEDTSEANLLGLTPGEMLAIINQNLRHDPQDPGSTWLTMTHLQLSPLLGASTQVSGSWKKLPGDTTEPAVRSFKNRIVNGRDVIYRKAVTGRLYPLGHAAVQDTTVERRFMTGLSGSDTRLIAQVQVTVQQHQRSYDSRTWPFKKIELLLDKTPKGTTSPVPNYSGDTKYLVVNGSPFLYPCLGIDKAGHAVEFRMPLVFVPDTHTDFVGLANAYNVTDLAKNELGHLTVAEPAPASGDPRVPGATEVVADMAVLSVSGSSQFQPSVTEYRGVLPALSHLTGGAENLTIRYADKFKTFGFAAGNQQNPGEVVLTIGTALPVHLNDATSAGGLLGAVSADVTGMSRRLGAVAGPIDTIGNGTFDPNAYLGAHLPDLKLFGVFHLNELLAGQTHNLADAPKISAATIDGLRTQTFTWSVPLFQQQPELGSDLARLRRIDGTESRLFVESVLAIGADDQAHQRTTCTVTNVLLAVRLGDLDIVRVPLPSITFVSVDGNKPAVDVELGQVAFGGVLAFVNRLADLIDPRGFKRPQPLPGGRATDAGTGGPSLDVTPSGVRAGFALAIPSVAIGAFCLENIAFGASLELPFQNGAPAMEFNFATFDNQFRCTVALLAGGGFAGIRLSTVGGLERLEAALEFGAQLALNLYVAKGKVAAMGGVYFKLEGGEAALTGYLTIKGELSVLSLVTCGVMQTLSLEYREGKLTGRAELVFYVSTFFFSKTIRKDFERTFVGSNGDPTFAELMAPPGVAPRPWDIYCTAFV